MDVIECRDWGDVRLVVMDSGREFLYMWGELTSASAVRELGAAGRKANRDQMGNAHTRPWVP